MWTLHPQQQQRGAQMPPKTGAAPADAVAGREAQEHDRANLDAGGDMLQPGEFPASALEQRDGDVTPSAEAPTVEWDEVVQPEQAPSDRGGDDRPLPEGK